MSDSLQPHKLYLARLLCSWGFSRQVHWTGCHFLLQGIFPTQGPNPGLPHCRWILYHLSHQGIPYIWQPLIFFSPLVSLPALCWRYSSDFCLDYPLLVSTSLNNLIQPGDFNIPSLGCLQRRNSISDLGVLMSAAYGTCPFICLAHQGYCVYANRYSCEPLNLIFLVLCVLRRHPYLARHPSLRFVFDASSPEKSVALLILCLS